MLDAVLGVPAPVTDDGHAVADANLPGLATLDLRAAPAAVAPVPAPVVNDADLADAVERRLGAGVCLGGRVVRRIGVEHVEDRPGPCRTPT